jgi:hypothetical protein
MGTNLLLLSTARGAGRGQAYLMLHNGGAAAAEFQAFGVQQRMTLLVINPPKRIGQKVWMLSDGILVLPTIVEGCRPRHPHPEAGHGGIREAAVN